MFVVRLIVCVYDYKYCSLVYGFFFFFKQKTAYEMRISDWSSDVCSSDLLPPVNIGEVSNKGYEIEIGGKTQIGKVGIDIKGNYSFARNKILYIDEPPAKHPWQQATGLPIGTQKQYIWEETFYMDDEDIANSATPPGAIQHGWRQYHDLNADGLI